MLPLSSHLLHFIIMYFLKTASAVAICACYAEDELEFLILLHLPLIAGMTCVPSFPVLGIDPRVSYILA